MIVLPEDKRITELLTPDEAKQLLIALSDEELSDSASVPVKMAYEIIYGRNSRISKKQSENGTKGGAPVGNYNAKKQPKQPKTTQTTQRDKKQPKQASVTDTDTVTNNTPDMLKHITPKGVCDSPFDVALRDFVEMRKKIKAPLTERAAVLLLNELGRLAPNDEKLKIKILEQSTMHDWKSVYLPKENTDTNRTRGAPSQTSAQKNYSEGF